MDEIIIRISHKGVLDAQGEAFQPRMLRIGRPELVNVAVHEILLEKLLEQMSGQSYIDGSSKRMRHRLIQNAQIIATTLNSAGSLTMCDVEHHFDAVIIDEAAQSVEPSMLIPLKFRPDRVILIGDHRQLPATVLSKVRRCCRHA